MRRHEGTLLFSSGDLTGFVGCRHSTVLDLHNLTEPLPAAEDSDQDKLVQEAGIKHERAYLAALKGRGHIVVEIPDVGSLEARATETLAAMRDGVDVVYQGVLLTAPWHGYADFLVKVPGTSNFGKWSYEAADTKLARKAKPSHVLQHCVYTELLAAVQGHLPQQISVALGTGDEAQLRTADVIHYFRNARNRFEAFVASPEPTEAEPCGNCRHCKWRDLCAEEWQRTDHLSLVAGMRVGQARKLRASGIVTVKALASAPAETTVAGMTPETFEKLRSQASLQVRGRETGEAQVEILPVEPARGFLRMPKSAEGDLFFDMEGDPLHDGGLEYLFGVFWMEDGQQRFRGIWGHDRESERIAFEQFMDFATGHLAQHPGAHIYHYNHYEPNALKRLSCSHGTREEPVDNLLRQERLVDLLKVVREGIRVSEPAYSLKNLESFYMAKRSGEVATAGDSIVVYERWRATGDNALLQEIEDYNRTDCLSTMLCRDWLLNLRPAGLAWFVGSEKAEDPTKAAKRLEEAAELVALEQRLIGGGAADEVEARRELANMLEYHRRNQKPEWWSLFDRRGKNAEELLEEADCLAGLVAIGPQRKDKLSYERGYSFPEQETKLRVDDQPTLSDTLERAGTIGALDMQARRLTLRRSTRAGDLPDSCSLLPPRPYDDRIMREAVCRVAESVAAGDGRFGAIMDLLKREPPRVAGLQAGTPLTVDGEDPVKATIRVAAGLDEGVLFVQGPPGAGKTYTAARAIVALMKAGKRIGVASNSHKAINNLLQGVVEAATEASFPFTGWKKSTAGDEETRFEGGAMIRNVDDADEVPVGAQLIAGTAWLFARSKFEGAVDYLFIDEAGQVALANVVAMGTAARNIVLVGDQMQLGQPAKGSHPGQSGLSVLDYLLQGVATVSPDRGIFLGVTHRMHPKVCKVVSQTFYDGRLTAAEKCEARTLLVPAGCHPAIRSAGVSFLEVIHEGRSQSCPEEAEEIGKLIRTLVGMPKADGGVVGLEDILVITPYNAQVNLLRASLPSAARVGTVDKFQGQEADVALLSMTTSSVDEMPRAMDFLLSPNRLNVAISRAKRIAIVVASPRLLEVPCSTVENMFLVNRLCALHGHRDARTNATSG